MKLFLTPISEQPAHDDWALDAFGLAIAIKHGHLIGGHLEADFVSIGGHGLGLVEVCKKATHPAQLANAARAVIRIDSGQVEATRKTRRAGLIGVGGNGGAAKHYGVVPHGSGRLCGLVSLLCRRGLGDGQFWHENIWVLHFYVRWDAAPDPVLDALRAACLFKTQYFSDLGRAAKVFYQFCIGWFGVHDDAL